MLPSCSMTGNPKNVGSAGPEFGICQIQPCHSIWRVLKHNSTSLYHSNPSCGCKVMPLQNFTKSVQLHCNTLNPESGHGTHSIEFNGGCKHRNHLDQAQTPEKCMLTCCAHCVVSTPTTMLLPQHSHALDTHHLESCPFGTREGLLDSS